MEIRITGHTIPDGVHTRLLRPDGLRTAKKNINRDRHATFRQTLVLAMTFIDMVIRLARPNRQTLERRYERIAEPLDIRGAGNKSSRRMTVYQRRPASISVYSTATIPSTNPILCLASSFLPPNPSCLAHSPPPLPLLPDDLHEKIAPILMIRSFILLTACRLRLQGQEGDCRFQGPRNVGTCLEASRKLGCRQGQVLVEHARPLVRCQRPNCEYNVQGRTRRLQAH